MELYLAFDPAVRTGGIPPATEPHVRRWLDVVLAGHSVVAWDGTRAVGQAVLLPDGDRGHELAVFVHQTYHHRRVGSRLVDAILAIAAEQGVERVGILTAGDNRALLALALRRGFVVTGRASGQVELSVAFPTTGAPPVDRRGRLGSEHPGAAPTAGGTDHRACRLSTGV